MFCSELPKCWFRWIPWAEYWYNTTSHISINATAFQVLYGSRRPPPAIVSYDDKKKNDEDTLEQQLIDREHALLALKEHLLQAQEREECDE